MTIKIDAGLINEITYKIEALCGCMEVDQARQNVFSNYPQSVVSAYLSSAAADKAEMVDE